MKKRMKHRVPLLLILCLLCACLPGRLVATAEAEDTKTYLYRLPLSDDDARLDSAWSTKWGHGALTFKNAVNQWAIASKLPAERLLIETDCPYMTPVPFRGKRNDPSFITYTFDKLCELRGADREELAAILYQNSFDAFGIEHA